MKKLIFSLLFLFSAACAFSQYDFYTQMLQAGQAMMQQSNAQLQAQFQQMNSNFWSNYQAGQRANNYNQGSAWEQANSQSQSTNYNSNTSNSSTEKKQTQKETKTRRCFKCNGTGRYDCPCFHQSTYGSRHVHKCPNCGEEHWYGDPHSCKCSECGGTGQKVVSH